MKIQSLKPGATAAERAVVVRRQSEGPLAFADAEPHALNAQGADYAHLFAKMTGNMTSAEVTPWAYSSIAEEWFALDKLALDSATPYLVGRIELRGHERLCLAIDALDGDPNDTLTLWLGYSNAVQSAG